MRNHSKEKSHHSEKLKSELGLRLNKIQGQIKGIKNLIEKDTYCDDVLTQISSVQSALSGVGKLLLENHLRSCISDKIKKGDSGAVNEFIITVNRLLK